MKVNGWTLYWYPAFKEQFDTALRAVDVIKRDRPDELNTSDRAKLLKRVIEIVAKEIPQNPAHEKYEQGNTLGSGNRHWRRAKFLQRFRLFFRFSSQAKLIIYVWVNDENTLRKAGAKTDVYAVFEKRLKQGDPPTDWDDLLKQSQEIESVPNTFSEDPSAD